MADVVIVSSPSESLELDLDKCNGYGNCVLAAPGMFDLDLASNVPTVLRTSWTEEDRPDLVAAVGDCPAAALRLLPREDPA